MHDLAVFIGRFQPFHIGHKTIIDKALAIADRVMVLIGSSFEPRSLRNPWFFEEREKILRACFNPEQNSRIICKPLRDIRYNDALWLRQVQKAIYEIEGNKELDITLIGLSSPEGTGYFTSLFPQWTATPVHHSYVDIHGIDIRHHLFSGNKVEELQSVVTPATLDFLKKFMLSESGNALQQEHQFVQLYKKGWENAPFEPTHVTVDCVVIQSGHVLLVKRSAQPGKGLLALPGGFIHANETLLNAAIRKLKEETQIKVPVPVLIGSVKNQSVFDAPFRSVRGRTITHSFHMELRGEPELPKIKSGGETSKCLWMPLGHLDSKDMFEDHYFIIQRTLGMV